MTFPKLSEPIYFSKSLRFDVPTKLWVFGSLCFVHLSRDKDKFGKRSRRCIFVGYPYAQKGWKVFDLDKQEFFISRNVSFSRNRVSIVRSNLCIRQSETLVLAPIDHDWELTNLPMLEDKGSSSEIQELSPLSSSNTSTMDAPVSPQAPYPVLDNTGSPVVVVLPSSSSHVTLSQSPPDTQQVVENLGRRERLRIPSVKLKYYATYNAIHLENPSLSPPVPHRHLKLSKVTHFIH